MAEPGTITDEGVAALRARIGVARAAPAAAALPLPDEDTFRHVAEAYGDDNPLWCDPDYARDDALGRADRAAAAGRRRHARSARTRSPRSRAEHARPDEGRPAARRARVLLRRAPASGGRRCDPTAGSFRRNALVGVLDKPSEFAGPRRARVDRRRCSATTTGTVLSGQYRLMIRTEREKAREQQEVRRDRDRAVHRRRRSPRSTRSTRASGRARRRAALVGGRRTRATRSARW